MNPKNAKLVFKNYPLPNHKFAKKAAIAALAANEQGKFWEYHDKIFADFKNLSDQKLQQFAQQVGLDMAKFNKALLDNKLQQAVVRDMQDAQKAGVRGTPTIFVNGQLLTNRSSQGFQQAINKALSKTQNK